MFYKKLSSDRLYLSPVNIGDVQTFTRWINDEYVSERLGNFSTVFTEEKEKEILESFTKNGNNFNIVLHEGDKLIGNCNLFEVSQVNRAAHCGIFIGDEENRGKGFGQEALTLLLRFAFDTLNLHNVTLHVFSFNKNAVRCYEKTGFKIIGNRREAYFRKGKYYDVISMDILENEFREKNDAAV